MVNLLIYINPDRKFPKEHEELTKMQIENSLSLGWNPKDILLVTNFPFTYMGINALFVDDYSVFDQNRSTKIPAINQLFREEKIGDDLYWFHDHDAFQLVQFEVDLGNKDAGFTTHGYSSLWNAGSFFFKKSAEDIFQDIWKYMEERGTNEQNALTYMWQNNINGINERYKLMNQTYNIGIYHTDKLVQMSEKPIKVAHFHPHKPRHLELFRSRNLLPESLLEIFKKNGIE